MYQTAKESALVTANADLLPRGGCVMIDPGHGGMDGGAVGINEVLEKDLNIQVAQKLKVLLNLLGTQTDMTRTEDVSLGKNDQTIARQKVEDMRKRLELINSKPYDAMLSIHMNFYPESKYWGSQVFYSGNFPQAKDLAEHIQQQFRLIVAADNQREIKKASDEIYLMKHAQCPALVIECGFLSNPDEANQLCDAQHQVKLALAIASGYTLYYTQSTEQ